MPREAHIDHRNPDITALLFDYLCQNGIYDHQDENGAYGKYWYNILNWHNIPHALQYALDYGLVTREELKRMMPEHMADKHWNPIPASFRYKYRMIKKYCVQKIAPLLFEHADLLRRAALELNTTITVERNVYFLDRKYLSQGIFTLYRRSKNGGPVSHWTKRTRHYRMKNGITYQCGPRSIIQGIRDTMFEKIPFLPIYYPKLYGNLAPSSTAFLKAGTDVFYLTEEEYRKKYLSKIKNKKALQMVPWMVLKVLNKYFKRQDLDYLITDTNMRTLEQLLSRTQPIYPFAVVSNMLYIHLARLLKSDPRNLHFTYNTKRRGEVIAIRIDFSTIIPDVATHYITRCLTVPILKGPRAYIRLHDEQVTTRTQSGFTNLDEELLKPEYAFSYEDEQIKIIPLVTVEDYVQEHEIMMHCVNSHMHSVKEERMVVLHCQQPDKPYNEGFTVGLSKQKAGYEIWQSGGYMNTQPSEEFMKIIRNTIQKKFKLIKSTNIF